MNPIEMLKSFKGRSPKEIVMNQFMGGIENPMLKNMIALVNNGKINDVETFARNICKERGLDYDKELASFMNQLK